MTASALTLVVGILDVEVQQCRTLVTSGDLLTLLLFLMHWDNFHLWFATSSFTESFILLFLFQ